MKQFKKLFKEKIIKATLGTLAIILYVLAFVFALAACNSLKVEPLAMYIIDEGTHNSYSYAQNNKRRDNIVAPILIRGNRLEFDFTFKKNHIYDYTAKDGGDINKLYGITSPKIHENSARFGWRYIGNSKFEVFAYYYVRGKGDWKLLYTASINEPLSFSVDVSNKQYTFGVNGSWHHVYGTKNIMAFRSFPYFGGNNKAPHTMYFTIVEL